VRRATHLQVPAVASRLRRARLHRHALAGIRPPPPVAGLRRLRPPSPAVRRGRPGAAGVGMISVTHFRTEDGGFAARARQALTVLGARPGFVRGSLSRSLDDESDWVLITEWHDVGSYRRALGNREAKLHA